MTDGTEIDDDEVFKSCSDGTVLVFMCDSDEEGTCNIPEVIGDDEEFSSSQQNKHFAQASINGMCIMIKKYI